MSHIEFMRDRYTTILLIESLIQHLQSEVLKLQQSWSYRELNDYESSIRFLQNRRLTIINELLCYPEKN